MKRKLWLLSVFPLFALALLVVSMMHPYGTNAAAGHPVHLSNAHISGTRVHAVRPFAGSKLIYKGGPVMGGTANAYAIFWEPTGSFVSSTYNTLLKRYFGDVGSSGLYHNNTQYTDSGAHFPNNAVLAASWVDTAAYPSNPISDTQVQNEVSHAMSVNHWTASIDNVFFVFTAKGEKICIDASTCSFTTFCAYHSFFGTNTIYAAMPYTGTNLSACGTPTSPNHDRDADSTINVTSHEQMEAATDPLLNAWYDVSGNEIGDKCAWNFGSTSSSGANVTWNGHGYIVQKEWDNARRACVKSGP